MEIIISAVFLNKRLQLILGKHFTVLLGYNKSAVYMIKHIVWLKQFPGLTAKGSYKEDSHRADQHQKA